MAELRSQESTNQSVIIAGGSAISAASSISRRFRDHCGLKWAPGTPCGHGAFRGPSGGQVCIQTPLSEYAHVATTTTHKTLRGPRGGMVLTNDEAISKKINSAVFPQVFKAGP